jgi:hypothetical protein
MEVADILKISVPTHQTLFVTLWKAAVLILTAMMKPQISYKVAYIFIRFRDLVLNVVGSPVTSDSSAFTMLVLFKPLQCNTLHK